MRLWVPAYGKRMLEARAAGRHPIAPVLISMGLWMNRTWPPDRLIVIPDDAPIGRLDLTCIAGLRCELVFATDPLPDAPRRRQLAAVEKARARAQELVDVAFASPVEAWVNAMIDLGAGVWAMAIPHRKPYWWRAPQELQDEWRRRGLAWSPERRRRAA